MTKKAIIISITLIIGLAALGFGWKHFHPSGKTTSKSPVETINYTPPTDEEKKAGDNAEAKKTTQPTNTSQTSNNTQGAGSASVAITDANVYNGQVEVRAFVSNVIADGTCTYIFTSGTKTITKTSPAKANVSTTNCLTLDFDKSELSYSSKWTVTVKYENQQKTVSGTAQTELNL